MATSDVTLRRLKQTQHHIQGIIPNEVDKLSIVYGPTEPGLLDLTLGELLDLQADIHGNKECLIVPWTGARWTYGELQAQSRTLAKALLSLGVRTGDRVAILASNCEEYVALFFAAGYLGCILVVLNSTYTAIEAQHALNHSGCKVLFVEEEYGRFNNTQLLQMIGHDSHGIENFETLEHVVTLRGSFNGFFNYKEVMENGAKQVSNAFLRAVRAGVQAHDVCNLQYTSGSTGDPKAAMLTHYNMINNARSIGDRMSFTPSDILCCPPPLYHCFGLVLGLLVCVTHGSTLVLPSGTFSAPAVLSAISDESCTALHGVPSMFEELLVLPRPESWSCPNLRTGIVAGAPVPKPLMERMLNELNMREFTSSYGLTEASPTCFNANTFDTIERRLTTVGRILPHLAAKVVDGNGEIVPIGVRGELYMSGYSLQKGYWRNEVKTREVMERDESGVLWLKTGDEAVLDGDGYCSITGRYKDIIIRGGENIYPLEIESRLVAHTSGTILRAAVIGIKHAKYGEVVGAFLLPSPDSLPLSSSSEEISEKSNTKPRPTDDDLRDWVREVLGRHKAPVHVFWFGDKEIGMDAVPQTGSGKVKKHVLRELAMKLVQGESVEEASLMSEF